MFNTKSLTYSITKVHRLMPESEAEKEGKIKPFEDGYQIEILGIRVLDTVK